MSLHVRVNSQSQTVKSGVVFGGVADLTNHGDNLHYQAINNDLMIALLSYNQRTWFISSGARSIRSIFGFVGQAEFDEDLIVHHKPVSAERGPGSPYDEIYHGNFSRGVLILGSVLSGRSFHAPSYSGENPSEHNTYSGELIAKQESVPLYEIPIDCYGQSITTEWTSSIYWRVCRVNQLDPLQVSLIPNYTTYCDYDFKLLVSRMGNREFISIISWNGSVFDRRMSNVRYSISNDAFKVQYHMNVVSSVPSYQHYEWDSTLTIPFGFSPGTISPVVNSVYGVQYGSSITARYVVTTATPYTGLNDSTFNVGTGNQFRCHATVLTLPPSTIDAEHAMAYNARSIIYLTGPLNSFEKAVKHDWHNIVPSIMFSTVDAFQAAEGYLGTNLLQNLAKISSIAKSLPQIAEALRILGKIAKRDISFLTCKEILDLATSTVLQANFEWRPYQSIVTQYLPSMASTLSSLGDIYKNSIGYGSFSFKINNDLGRKEVTLLTRTKLVMDASPSGFLSALLGFDALGLLPKTSNLWDLLPFSFIANWFTGVGSAMRRAEYSLLLMNIPAYFVHTYTITSPFTSEELDSFETSSSGDQAAGIRLYYRDVTLYSPLPMDSRFGFGIPKDFPPMGTFGSLLYQLFIS